MLFRSNANGIANTHRHERTSIAKAETKRPIIPPPPAKPAQIPMALPRFSGGKLDVMIDSVTPGGQIELSLVGYYLLNGKRVEIEGLVI